MPAPWSFSNFRSRGPALIRAPFRVYRIQSGSRGVEASAAVRSFLTGALHSIAGRPVTWEETAKGPRVTAPVENREISISISYARGEAWLALGLGTSIGIDAAEIVQVPDWEPVATNYLGAGALKRLRNSAQLDLDFAREWTRFEARLKLHGHAMIEARESSPAELCEACFWPVVVTLALPA